MNSRAFTLINVFEFCCSVTRCILSYWPKFLKLSGDRQWPSLIQEPLILALLDLFRALCWILYAQNQQPVSWFLMATNWPPLVSVMLYSIMLFILYQCSSSQIPCPAPNTLITLGILLLVFVVVGLLWICDVVTYSSFGILAIVTETLSSILTGIQLWHNSTTEATSTDSLLIPGGRTIIAQSILALVSGAIGLFNFTLQHDIIFLINSVMVLISGFLHLGGAFFKHKSHSVT